MSPRERAQRGPLGVVLALTLCCCTSPAPEGENGEERAAAAAPPQLGAGDQTALREGWVLAAARDDVLLTLLESSDGWVSYFQGDLPRAVAAFQQSDSLSERIGAVQSALKLAEAYRHWRMLHEALLGRWLTAERARPQPNLSSEWLCFLRERLPQEQRGVEGQQASAVRCDAERSTRLREAWQGEGSSAGQTARWRRRSALLARLSAAPQDGSIKRRFQSLQADKDDLMLEGERGLERLSDPQLFPLWERAAGALALQAASDPSLGAWGKLLQARAWRALGSAEEAERALAALVGERDRGAPPLLMTLLQESDAPSGLELELHARYARCAAERGDRSEAEARLRPLQGALAASRSSAQVWASWALAPLGGALDAPPFPERRLPLLNFLREGLSSLPKGEQVSALAFPERWVDALQGRLALSAFERDQRPVALQNLVQTEDHPERLQLSGRNRLPRLLLAARINLRMNRLRPAAKYLSRLRETFPASRPLAKLLAGVLSFEAKQQQQGGVNFGQ